MCSRHIFTRRLQQVRVRHHRTSTPWGRPPDYPDRRFKARGPGVQPTVQDVPRGDGGLPYLHQGEPGERLHREQFSAMGRTHPLRDNRILLKGGRLVVPSDNNLRTKVIEEHNTSRSRRWSDTPTGWRCPPDDAFLPVPVHHQASKHHTSVTPALLPPSATINEDCRQTSPASVISPTLTVPRSLAVCD